MLDAGISHLKAPRSTAWRRWPALAQLWPFAVVALVALRVQVTPVQPNDFWWHLATGRLVVEHGTIPQIDSFSYTQAGQAYYNQPWLAQVLLFVVHQLGGIPLLQFLQTIVVATTFAIVYRHCRYVAGPALAATMALGGATLGMDNWQIRPQSYALPLFALAYLILEQWRRHERVRLWSLPLLMLVWVNVHGTWILLPLLCGLFVGGAVVEQVLLPAARRRGWREVYSLLIATVAVLGATAINPRGLGVWRYVVELVGDDAVRQLVPEWTPAWNDLGSPTTVGFVLVICGLGCLLVLRRQRVPVSATLCFLCFGALAWQSVRNIMWWGIIAAPIAAWLLAPPSAEKPRRRVEIVLLNRIIAGGLLLMVVLTLPWWKGALGLPAPWGELVAAHTPVAATAQLQQLPQPPQRLFHSLEAGSYLIWAAPEQRVFVDSRIELYPYAQWQDYITLNQGNDVDRLAQRYGFDGWLVDRRGQAALLAALDRNSKWQKVFAMDEAVYFGRR